MVVVHIIEQNKFIAQTFTEKKYGVQPFGHAATLFRNDDATCKKIINSFTRQSLRSHLPIASKLLSSIGSGYSIHLHFYFALL